MVFLELLLFVPYLSVLIHYFVVPHLFHFIFLIELVSQARLFLISTLLSFPLGFPFSLFFDLIGVWHIPKLVISDPLSDSED